MDKRPLELKRSCAIGMTGRKELKMDSEFGYGMKYYNDDDPAPSGLKP